MEAELHALVWEKLAELRFEDAYASAESLSATDPSDERYRATLACCSHWKHATLAFKKEEDNRCEKLKSLINDYQFEDSWGHQSLKKSLLRELVCLAEQEQVFLFNDGSTLADLYMTVGDAPAAERTLSDQLSVIEDAFLRARLADIQWREERYGEARANYLRALLDNPFAIKTELLENRVIATAIQNHGRERAAAWCILYGEHLPYSITGELIASGMIRGSKTAKLCEAISAEERAVETGNIQEATKHRKEMHELDPTFCHAYMQMKRGAKRRE